MARMHGPVALLAAVLSTAAGLHAGRANITSWQLQLPGNVTFDPAAMSGGKWRQGETTFKIINRTDIGVNQENKCLCPDYMFWHFRNKRCVPQGSRGYECGFFPKDIWHRVCLDGLKCGSLEKKESEYHEHAGATAAACVPCLPEDNCLYGKARQEAECVKQNFLDGEACIELEVTAAVVGKASVTEAADNSVSMVVAGKTEGGLLSKAEPKVTIVTASGHAEVTKTSSEATNAVAKGKSCLDVPTALDVTKHHDLPKTDDGKPMVGPVIAKRIQQGATKAALELAYKNARAVIEPQVQELYEASVKKAEASAEKLRGAAKEEAKQAAAKDADSKLDSWTAKYKTA